METALSSLTDSTPLRACLDLSKAIVLLDKVFLYRIKMDKRMETEMNWFRLDEEIVQVAFVFLQLQQIFETLQAIV